MEKVFKTKKEKKEIKRAWGKVTSRENKQRISNVPIRVPREENKRMRQKKLLKTKIQKELEI